MFKQIGISPEVEGQVIAAIASYGTRIIAALALLFAAIWLSNRIRDLVFAALHRAHIEETLVKFIGNVAKWVVLCFSGVSILGVVGIETASFAAVIAASGLAVGLAFQGTLSNMAAGLMLLIFRPFHVGQIINISGHTGVVAELGLFSTTLDTLDNRRIIIPNSSVFGQTIENVSFHAFRRVDVSVGVSYDADIDKTRAALGKVPGSVSLVVKEPPSAIVMTCLGASSVDWQVRAYAKTDDYLVVQEALLEACKRQLDLANITIPYPQLTVHVNK